ncbi:hypothetical protein Trydic_g9625 [Trypoxylus dichotomus]
MSAENKVRVYKTAIRPVLTYAAETRVNITKAKNMMRAVEMKTLRTTKRVSLRDQMRSKLIREDLEIQDIVFTSARRRFYRDHVDRMTEGRWAKSAKDEKPNRRPSGLPRKRRS